VSLASRIVLLNSVLNAIPIFHLSYLKMSVQIWKEMHWIHREVLWGGLSKARKINWIKTSLICKPKSVGGLGGVRLVNSSLVTKWRWRLIESNQSFWKELIRSKYVEGWTVFCLFLVGWGFVLLIFACWAVVSCFCFYKIGFCCFILAS
jgi:hypothetical protein